MIRWFNSNVNIFYHYFCKKTDLNHCTRHGGELIASVLQSHGVQHLFTLSGGHISPILTAAEKLGIRIVDTRHEVTTVFAADATARLSGIPGVAVVTAGPGVANTVTAVKNAQMAESPLILLGGATASPLKGCGALQDIDQLSIFKSITKKTYHITKVRDIVPQLKEAFHAAQSQTPGPIFVELPMDILYPYSFVRKQIVSNSGENGLRGKIENWFQNNYLQNLFADAFDAEPDLRPLPLQVPYPKQTDIAKAVELICQAKKPLILLGSQSTLPPIGAANLRKAIETIGIPVYLGGMSRGLLGRHSPIQMRHSRKEALQEADLIILGGSVVDFRLSYGRVFSKNAKIIAINRNRQKLYQNSNMSWKPNLAVEGDAAKFFVDLAASLDVKWKIDPNWLQTLQTRDRKKEFNTIRMASEKPNKHLNPIDVLQKLENSLDDDQTIMIADGGDFVGSAAYIMRPRGPLSWLDPGAFGTLGCGAGFAIGAKLCRPDHDVVIIFGDGSLGYSLMEFDTMIRHKLPVMGVVGNDACWTQIAREQKPTLGSDVACNLAYTSYEKTVESLGGIGMMLDASEREKIDEMFVKAKKQIRNGSSVLVNVLISKSKFRDGSVSI